MERETDADRGVERHAEYTRQIRRAARASNSVLADALETMDADGLKNGDVATLLETARRLRALSEENETLIEQLDAPRTTPPRDGESDSYRLLDTFVEGVGTVRECLGCRALIAGGPTRCVRCAKEGDPTTPEKSTP